LFSNGLLEERAAFGGGIVGDNHADHAANGTNPGDEPGAGHRVVVQSPGRERREFEERTQGVDQQINAFAHRNLAAVAMPLHHAVAAAGQRPGLPRAQCLEQPVVNSRVGLIALGSRIDRAR
jgi:hypothetical protein